MTITMNRDQFWLLLDGLRGRRASAEHHLASDACNLLSYAAARIELARRYLRRLA